MSLRDLASKAVMILEDGEIFMPEWKEEADKLANALRAALAEPQPEPVAWMYRGIRHDGTLHENESLIWRPEYMDVMSEEQGAKATPLYAHPPQRQPLSDEEISGLELPKDGTCTMRDLVRIIERAHDIGGDK